MKKKLLIVLLGLTLLLIFPELSLAQFGSISGRVTDEGTGLPLVTAQITITGIYGVWYTDTSGYYWCDSLPPGWYLVNAQKEGYVPETYPDSVIVIAGQNTPHIDFALTASGEYGSISGQVTDEETGLPIIMAHLLAIGLDNFCYGEAWSDTGGYYAIQNMCPGFYQVSANKTGYIPETYPDSVMVIAGEDTPNIDFALTPAGPMGSISGTVTDEETGLPLPMAHVLAYDSTFCAGDAWTDTAGYYLIQNLVASQYMVAVHKDGYEDEVYPESVTVEEGQNTPDIDFALTPSGGPEFGSISGTVTDEDTGLPIVMAEITIPGIYCVWYTDTSGYYLCGSLPPGLYLVNAQKEGYVPETYPDSVMVIAGENSPGIDFALTPIGEYGSISGQVTDEETGLPIIMARVLAIGLDNWCYGEAWSDTGGYYAIQNMCAGFYQVSASKIGYIPETYPDSVMVIAGEDTPNIDLALSPAGPMGSISGTVTDEETGLPLPMAHVLAYDSTFCAGDAWTDTAGYYLIQNLVASQYMVAVHKDGYEDEVYPESVTVEEGQNTPDIDFALTPSGGPEFGSISGVVTDEETGLPIIMAEITITGIYCIWYTDTVGYYFCDNLPPDSYQVNARKMGYTAETYPESVVVIAGETTFDIDFALAPMGEAGSISGAVTDAETGYPIPGAHVYACGEFGHGQALTDSLGEYTIFGLYPGSYFVTAWAWGYWPQDYPDTVSIVEGQNIPGIDFALVPHGGPGEGVIAGQVLDDSTLSPMPFAVVLAISLSGNWGFDFTDSVGTYMIGGLQTDDYYVYAFAPGYIGEFYDGVYTWEEATLVTPDAYDIDFYLAPCGSGGGSISGTINSDDSPVEDAFVYAEASGEVKGFARSSTEGGYIINGLAPGAYTVSASKVSYHDGSYPDPVEIGSGKVSGVDIELPPIQVGDVTENGLVDIGDVIFLINYLFIEGPAPDPLMTGDVNCDGMVDTGDVIYVINYLYLQGPSPCNP
jgi:protocatechuate 3,4-dioxygenase beta subunit